MGIVDNSSLLGYIDKVITSWISWGSIDTMNSVSSSDVCCSNGEMNTSVSCLNYHCHNCGKRVQDHVLKETSKPVFSIESCKFCSVRRNPRKVCPVESLRQSPETDSPSFTGDESFSDHPSPLPICRSDEDEAEDHALSPSSKYFQETSDVDSVRNKSSSFTSVGSTAANSPSRIHFTFNRIGCHIKQEPEQAVLEKPAKAIWDPEKIDDPEKWPKLEETETMIWFPPLPHNVADEAEDRLYDDDEDDDEVGILGSPFLGEEKLRVNPGQAHFKALVSELLHRQGVISGKDNFADDWLDITTTIAWQAASFIKPDTSQGGSMDPCDYVKVKCVASGSPVQSNLVKGIVCTKNIKHKRMTSQYKNTRMLLLGGALECHRDPNKLASFETLLQQETDSLRTIVSKIEAHRPNVLLVEKTASSFAQDLLLAKDISLVLNVKRPLLERIARCSGAIVTPSTDHLSTARLGHCQLFHLEKISEDHEPVNQFNRKPSKTLMFFEGCPRRLGCTIILRGSSRKELKKVKNAVQYAVFAAYHLSLETSFIANEGARLPKTGLGEVIAPLINAGSADLNLEFGLQESLSELGEISFDDVSTSDEFRYRQALSEACDENLALNVASDHETGITEYYLANDNNQSILVSFSSHCILNETVCERSRLLRLKFYGPSDKPLGRYLRDDLFSKTSQCRSCKASVEAHAICYTHPHGNLMINVRRLSSICLPGEDDGKIWMWHRCLLCTHAEGVPPAIKRVVMSNAAWGLSFGKFLELSFSKHATGNRVASCGHSLQRDCLRFYGFGSMIACFRYSPINILSVRLPPSVLEFGGPVMQRWIRKEASELCSKVEVVYAEISAALDDINHRSLSDVSEWDSHIVELNNKLTNEKDYYKDLLQDQENVIDILEINRLRHSLLLGLHDWDRRLYLLNSVLQRISGPKGRDGPEHPKLGESNAEEPNPVRELDKMERVPSGVSILSDQMDSGWSGSDSAETSSLYSPALKRLLLPTRVYSFDSAQRLQEGTVKQFLTLRSFHASGDYKYMVKDPVSKVHRTYSQVSPHEADPESSTSPNFILCGSLLPDGARLMVLPQNGQHFTVYDDEPTSIISYALRSQDYVDWIDTGNSTSELITRQSFGSFDVSNDVSSSHHLRVSFEDDSGTASGRVKFSVTCYFAKQFDNLRKRCCPNEVDFIRSMSRCRRWSAQGGKSNVYFAKSFDERFIIKQVTKTELESFDEFALEYFKYFTGALSSGNPTCLAKILGIYQVAIKHLKTGKETRMDVMVMENLFFGRNISKVYDLKGSERSRYNSDTTGTNKVLLDMNLLETLRTNPIFLNSKAKRRLERAIWNDTLFLASIDVMDYSLLVGVDEEEKELVVGIIDYMRQYTWDKHLETWVKASGILGGPKNASPTIVSPKQYKKRFRKAMATYFLTVPHQWSSS